ncbi:MAG: phenylacetate--CoA ligase family protein [Pirellulales bacterium]
MAYDQWMHRTNFENRRRLESLHAEPLAAYQLERLNDLLANILPGNRFYADKLGSVSLPLTSLEQLTELPYTFKEELVSGERGSELAANLTHEPDRYVRLHRTSGTHGRPMIVMDTAEDWQWWLNTWQFVLDAAGVEGSDRAFMAFSFGPFIGFWSAYDALVSRGALVVPGGGMDTLARIELIRACRANVLCCTPSYALHMAEIARENQVDPAKLPVDRIIVAGEPGGSQPSIRQRIEQTWEARLIDHSGATEVGPWGYGSVDGAGLYLVESEFIAEFLSVETGQPAGEQELSELVLTTLGRHGSPVIRYRTGDLVRPTWNRPGSNRFVFLEGGVLGRADDMLVIRGVNVFPSSVEQILRSFPEVVEYRIIACRSGEMDALRVQVEDRLNHVERIEKELKLRLGLRVPVETVPLGTLPRFEGKGKRFIDERPRRF